MTEEYRKLSKSQREALYQKHKKGNDSEEISKKSCVSSVSKYDIDKTNNAIKNIASLVSTMSERIELPPPPVVPPTSNRDTFPTGWPFWLRSVATVINLVEVMFELDSNADTTCINKHAKILFLQQLKKVQVAPFISLLGKLQDVPIVTVIVA